MRALSANGQLVRGFAGARRRRHGIGPGHPLTGPEFALSVNRARVWQWSRYPAVFFRIPAGSANKKPYAAVNAGTAAAQSPSIAAGSIGSRSRSKQPS
jgi:hypothetical protein